MDIVVSRQRFIFGYVQVKILMKDRLSKDMIKDSALSDKNKTRIDLPDALERITATID